MQTVKLGTLGTFQSGGTPKKSEPRFFGGKIPWISTTALDGAPIGAEAAATFLTDDALRHSAAKLVPAGSLLVGIRIGIGKNAVNRVPMATSQDIVAITGIDTDRWSLPYLMLFLEAARPRLQSLARGATIQGIQTGDVKNLDVPDLPLAEQQRIVRELQQVGALLANRRQVDEQLAELPKARFVEMFGDPVVNPRGWEKQRISNISIRANNGMARRGNDPDGNIVLRLVELQDGYIDYQAPNRILLTPGEKEKYLLTEGDFLFARVNGNPENVGRCAVFHDIGEPVYHNDHIIRYHFNQHIDGTYLSALLNSYYGKWQMHSKIKTSAGQYTISQDGIGEVEVPLPPLDLQRRFAAFARACAAQRAACARQIAVLETLRGKLLQDAFGAAG